MLSLPIWQITILNELAPALYGITTWYKGEMLVSGAILATGKRTVSAVLRGMGLSQARNDPKYQQVLSRAVWSGLEVSLVLWRLLLKTLAGLGPLIFGIDETIERRRGEKSAAKGIYRADVRSSKSHFVKASGVRWMSGMWLTPLPLARRIGALRVLTALAPSDRYYQARRRKAQTVLDWARQRVFQLRRWLPNQAWVVVGDSAYAALDLLQAGLSLKQPMTVITRLRLDAALYDPPPLMRAAAVRARKEHAVPRLSSGLTTPRPSGAA